MVRQVPKKGKKKVLVNARTVPLPTKNPANKIPNANPRSSPANHTAIVFDIPIETNGPPIPKIAANRTIVGKFTANPRRTPERATKTKPKKIAFFTRI